MSWTLIGLLLVLAAVAAASLWLLLTDSGQGVWNRLFGGGDSLTDLQGHDSLATEKELGAEDSVRPKDPHSVVAGYFVDARNAARVRRNPDSGKLVCTEPFLPVLTFGPPGSGKTSAVLIPSILTWGQGRSPVLAGSVKHDLAAATIKLRSQVGRVWIFAPSGKTPPALQQHLGMWTPLAAARTWQGAVESAGAMVFAAAQGNNSGGGNDGFWEQQSVALLAALLYLTANQKGTSMQDVSQLLGRLMATTGGEDDEEKSTPRTGFQELYAQVQERLQFWENVVEAKRRAADEGKVSAAEATREITAAEKKLDEFQAASETLLPVIQTADAAPQTIGGVVASCANVLGVYRYARDHARVAWDDPDLINIDEFLDSAATIYLVAPPRNQKLYAPLLAAFASAVINRAYEKAQQNPTESLDYPLLACLDEIHAMPIADLPTIFATARSYKISLLTATQDFSQLCEKYGEYGAASLLSSSSAVLVLPRTKDPKTLRTLSDIAGEVYVKNESKTTSTSKSEEKGGETKGKQTGSSESVTESWEHRPLLPPGRIAGMADQEAFAVIGSHRAQLLQRRFFSTPILKRLADGDVTALDMPDTFAVEEVPYSPAGKLVDFTKPVEPEPVKGRGRLRR